MPNPVVITRPLAQCAALAAQIERQGRQVCLLPLLRILPLEQPEQVAALQAQLARLSEYALVAFVSPNAIEACFAQMRALGLTWPATTAIAVMGEGSRAALVAQGIDAERTRIFAPSDKQRTDSETLLEELDLPHLRGQQVLIVRGQHGREWLFEALQAAGVQAQQIASYQRLPASDELRENLQLALQQSHHWLITSSEALRSLMQMLEKMQESSTPLSAVEVDIVAKMKQQHMIVPHLRIAQTAQSLGFCNITQCAAGDVGLLAALQSLP